MAAVITDIEPGRGRDGDTAIVITGTGFSPTDNGVTVDGQVATVTLDSATSVEFTVPAGISIDQFVDVILTNNDDSSTSARKWWAKQTIAALGTEILPGQIPGPFENDVTESATVAEAKDYERLATLAEFNRSNSAVPVQSTVNSNTVLTDASNETVFVDTDTAAADVTITLPASPSTQGRSKLIRNTGTTGFNVIITSVDNINGSPLDDILFDGQWAQYESDATDWEQVS